MGKSPDAFRTISEVADWLETPAHVLRFWESRFPQIRPVKRAGGRRYYRPSDVALLGGIKKLLHDDGITIRGVQKILREQGIRHVARLGQQPEGLEPEEMEADEAPMSIDAVEEPETGVVISMPARDRTAEAPADAIGADHWPASPTPDVEESATQRGLFDKDPEAPESAAPEPIESEPTESEVTEPEAAEPETAQNAPEDMAEEVAAAPEAAQPMVLPPMDEDSDDAEVEPGVATLLRALPAARAHEIRDDLSSAHDRLTSLRSRLSRAVRPGGR